MTHPLSPKAAPWRRHLLFWVLFYLFYLFQYIFFADADKTPRQYGYDERALIVFVHLLSIIATSYFICFRIFPLFSHRKILQAVLEFIAGFYLICVLQRIIVIYLLEPLLPGDHGTPETLLQILTQIDVLLDQYMLGTLSGTFPFVIFYLLMERQQMIRRQSEIEKQKAVAELNALKSQLNPHFLFNTLNNIYSLSVKQSPLAAPAVDKLSQILDYLLYRCNEKYVPLEKELELLNNYLDLQKTRFGNRVLIKTDFEAGQGKLIAPLLLLSIVENMFKHGVEKTIGVTELLIRVRSSGNEIMIVTENPFDEEESSPAGIGLNNLRQQLQLLYPGRHLLTIHREADKFVFQLQLTP